MTPHSSSTKPSDSLTQAEFAALLESVQGVEKFLDKLGSDEPTPGGGATAAVMGAIACAQASMVAELSLANKECQKDSARIDSLKELLASFKELQGSFRSQILNDAAAYGELSAVFKMKRDTEAERQERHTFLQQKLEEATVPPFAILNNAGETLEAVKKLANVASSMARPDLIVAALALKASARGAEAMVLANTCYLSDAEKAEALEGKAAKKAEVADSVSDEIFMLISRKHQLTPDNIFSKN